MSETNGTQPAEYANLIESIEALENDNMVMSETIRDLELALDSVDWRRLTHFATHEFSRDGIRRITEIARLFYLKNPLIKRGVDVQTLYVWGQGWSVRAKDDTVQEVIDEFLKDRRNQDELTSQKALVQKDAEQQTDANTFLVFFTNRATGRVRVRTIPLEEISDIYCSPDDAKEPWYYRRTWSVERLTETGGVETEQTEAYYPDWHYNPVSKPKEIGGLPVMWDTPIFHIKTGSFSNWKFGVSEVYSAVDWAEAYKKFLEDFASITRAHRRFAWDLSVPGGKTAIAAAKTKLNTTVGTGVNRGFDTNPPSTSGSTFIRDGNTQMTPMRTAGATVGLEDGRRIALMAFAGMGLPETFFGDVSVGTLATAISLDRPTELMMRNRQMFWHDIFTDIFKFVLLQSAKATSGALRGIARVEAARDGGQIEERLVFNGDDEGHIDIDFPPLVSLSRLEEVQSIVAAATLNGGTPAGTIDIVNLSRMLLSALAEDDIDEIINQNFPNGEIPDWADPEKRMERAEQQMSQDGSRVRQAAESLKRRLQSISERAK